MIDTAYKVDLLKDLVVQFQDQPKLSALLKVIQKQFDDVAVFYTQLKVERWLDTAEGDQLDRIGDIVCLTRGEAGELASLDKSINALLEDDEYRKYLIFKIWKNTNNCTYYDVIKAFRMFWSRPLYYSEHPDEPATMFFETEALKPFEMDVEELFRIPIIRAAGVGIHITAITQADEAVHQIYPLSHLGRGCQITHIPEFIPDMPEATLNVHGLMPRWSATKIGNDVTPFGLVAHENEEIDTLSLYPYLPMLGYHTLSAWEEPSNLSLHIECEGLIATVDGTTLIISGG